MEQNITGLVFRLLPRYSVPVMVFPITNCPYRGVKLNMFWEKHEVLIGEFSTFTIKSLQNNTYNAKLVS